MEKLESSKSGRTTNRFKSKKILLRFSLTERIIDLLKTLETLYRLKLTGH